MVKLSSEATLIARRYNEIAIFILLVVIILNFIGLLSIYSVAFHGDTDYFQKNFYKQLIWSLMGIAFAVSLFFFQKNFLYNSAYFFYLVGLMILIVPFFLPTQIAGTNRWISVGFFRLQPSEFMKIAFILAVAKYLSSFNKSKNRFYYLIVPLLMALIPAGIIFKQPDFGTAIVFMAIVFPMLFWAEVRLFHLFLIAAPFLSIVTAFNFYSFFIWAIIVIAIIYFSNENILLSLGVIIGNIMLGMLTPILWNKLQPYQQKRILTLFNIQIDPQGAGYQVIQSQTAIGSGGLFGKGLGNGTQTHLKFLPEQHTDFIFSVVGEEFGFAATTLVIILYLILILAMIYMAYKSKDQFSALTIIGVAFLLLFHVFVNIGMTIGIMPVTGLPLPFLSYGGSFLLSCYLAIGLVLNALTEQY